MYALPGRKARSNLSRCFFFIPVCQQYYRSRGVIKDKSHKRHKGNRPCDFKTLR
ncbi:hypothetical protein SAMN02927903_03393, partial [Flavobacterium caeni]